MTLRADDPYPRARFLEENHDFWSGESAAGPNAPHVVIDLCHYSPAYLVANLVTGKYLARLLGARTLGIAARTWPAWTHFDRRRVLELARSYRLDAVVELEPETPAAFAAPPLPSATVHIAALREAMREGSGSDAAAAVRDRLLETTLPGNPGFGRTVYDSVLRHKLAATLDGVDDDLERILATGTCWDETIRSLYASLPIAATVLGHLEYLPYGSMARASIENGAPVYHQWPCVPVTLRRSRSHEDLDHGLATDFVDAYRARILPLVERDEEALARFRRGFSRRFRRIRAVRQRTHLADRSDATAVLEQAGVASPRPKVAVLCHSFADSVHMHGGLLYHDFGQWLSGTLAIAERQPDVDFLIKPHPLHRSYDADGFLDRLREASASCPNVGFLAPEDAIEPLIPHLSGAVTAHGSPGYELALAGVPTATIGRTRYEGLGIAERLESTADYARWTRTASRREVSPERRRAALAFAAFETVAGRSRAAFIPETGPRVEPLWWADATRRLHGAFIEEDPLFRNLEAMVEQDLPFLANLDYAPGSERVKSRSPLPDHRGTESRSAGRTSR